MIRINLLPTKKTKKAAVVEKRLLYGAAGFIGIVLVFVFLWMSLNSKISALEEEKAHAQQIADELKTQIQDVQNFEKDRKALEEKITIIEGLRKQQGVPVRMLDDLSAAVPDGLWLVSMVESGGKINIDGSAFSNDDIVAFVNNLKASSNFTDVLLNESVMESSSAVARLYRFKVALQLKK